MARVKKSSTNLQTKLHHLERSASRKVIKDEKYKTQKHLIGQFEQFVDEEKDEREIERERNLNAILEAEELTFRHDYYEMLYGNMEEIEPYHPGLR